MTLLALIVDDEAPARGELRHLLTGIDGIEVAGEAASAREALVLAERERNQLLQQERQVVLEQQAVPTSCHTPA